MKETENKQDTISKHGRKEQRQLSQRITANICSKNLNMFNDSPEEVTRIIETECNVS